MKFVHDHHFEKADFSTLPAGVKEFDGCTFSGCVFERAIFNGFQFTDCTFIDCNLSLVDWKNTSLHEVAFEGCKMTGTRFDTSQPFNLAIAFKSCLLDHALFTGIKIPKTRFIDCRLIQTDFSGCDLSGADFTGSDLSGATFLSTNLEKADFRAASGFTIDPTTNRLRKARFRLVGLTGLLSSFGIDIEDAV